MRAKARKSASRKKKKKKESHAGLAVAIILLFLVALMAAGVFVTGTMVSRIDTVYPGTTLAGIDLSGMTEAEAAQALQVLGSEKYEGLSVTARLPLDNTLTVTAQEAGLV